MDLVRPAAAPIDFLSALRPEAASAPVSGIVELFDYGRGRQGLLPLWVGEGDLPTPDFIGEAAIESIRAGETFYSYQAGIPELREAIAAYMTGVYGGPFADSSTPFTSDRFFVTIGGMHALQIATRMVCGDGDEAIVLSPSWPNFSGAITLAGARPVEVPLIFSTEDTSAWRLDLDALAAAINPRTRVLFVNTPANPTGWTASLEELGAILDLARQHGLWIVADEIYGRLVYGRARAPSFHDLIDGDDRVLFVQTLSKNWAMTGWRVGWLEAPASLGTVIENLIQYSTSGVPVPTQRAALAALTGGEAFLARQIARMTASRDVLTKALAGTGRVRFAEPIGSFYLFCAFDGEPDTRALAFRLVDEASVGVAPGSAFGPAGAPFIRICFARDPKDIAEAAARLVRWLER